MLRKSFVLMVMGTVMFFLCSVASADVPDSINYQGKLTTASGGCLNETVQMTFTIYADAFGTVLEWSETQAEVEVKEGIFNVLLGSVNPLAASIFDGSAKYLGVRVESDPEMSLLKPMVTTAYAFGSHHAQEADTADYARAAPAAGIASVDGVSNPGGDVDLIQQDAITITPNDGADNITIGETHSARSDNPHTVTASQAGALVSSDGVSNPGGDVDFIQNNSITITPNDGANTITFGETHSGRTDNPHAVTAGQTGAPVAVDGVSNAGGDIDFIAGSNMTITPNDGANTITFSAAATAIPRGVIVMWVGTPFDVPAGWALCDGTKATPNLTDRFILSSKTGLHDTGGATSHDHTVDLPYMDTGGPSGTHEHGWGTGYNVPNGNHFHGVNPPEDTTKTANHLPPYYKLAFIMKD